MKIIAVLCVLLSPFAWAQNDPFPFYSGHYPASGQLRSAPSRNQGNNKPLSNPFSNNEKYYSYKEIEQQNNDGPNNYPFYTISDFTGAYYQNQFEGDNPFIQPQIPYVDSQFQLNSKVPYGSSPLFAGLQNNLAFVPLPLAVNPSVNYQQSQENDQDGNANQNKESKENNTTNSNDGSAASSQATSNDQKNLTPPVSFVLPLPTRSATGSAFTNAHHYPFPQGLMRYYYKQTGHQVQPNRQQTPLSNGHPLQYYYIMPTDSSYPYFPLGAPNMIPGLWNRGPLPEPDLKEIELNPDENDKNASNDNIQPTQTGKTSSDSDGDDELSPTRVRILAPYVPGFSELGPLYTTLKGVKAQANSRV